MITNQIFKLYFAIIIVMLMTGFAFGKSTVLIGKVPGRYLSGKLKTSSYLSKVVIENKIIQSVTTIPQLEADNLKSDLNKLVIHLKSDHGKYDIIYPGLFDLHNHTKQNNLPLWNFAKGQFANRFEWRKLPKYKTSVSNNMNPWISSYGSVVSCAAFRWSELQAMVIGTTFLQGPSTCVKEFGIHHIESGDGLLYDEVDKNNRPVIKKLKISAPTDIIIPEVMSFVWDVLSPKVNMQTSYSNALEKTISMHCPQLMGPINKAFLENTTKLKTRFLNAKERMDKKRNSKTIASYIDAHYNLKRHKILDSSVLKIITNKKTLLNSCNDYHHKFISYMSKVHETIAGKIKLIKHPRRSAVIAHLSEGRRLDPYNQLEFKMLKVLGLDQEKFNIVHGLGLNFEDYQHMAKQKMGLIWSPFSNLLLYGQTANIVDAKKAGVMIALGSDWTPTGSKSVLEELKIAKNFIKKKKLSHIFSDEDLYMMVTENPAYLTNYLEVNPEDGIHGAGKVVRDAIASLVIIRDNHENPHTNLVNAQSRDINLVLIKGDPLYGNTNYLTKFNQEIKYEILPNYYVGLNKLLTRNEENMPIDVKKFIPTPLHGKDLLDKVRYQAYNQLDIFDLVIKYEQEFDTIRKAENKALKESNIASSTLTTLKNKIKQEFLLVQNNNIHQYLEKVINALFKSDIEKHDQCNFPEVKGMVFQNSLESNSKLTKEEESILPKIYNNILELRTNLGVNLDRVKDIQILLGGLLLTQNKNILNPNSAPKSINYFPSLFSCNDPAYQARFNNFILEHEEDEISNNLLFRKKYRKEEQDKVNQYNENHPDQPKRQLMPEKLATEFGLEYDIMQGVWAY